jgi:Xaa-Pro aminopeptidase
VREVMREGGALTVEQLRRVAGMTLAEHGAVPHDMTIIAPGPQGTDLHGAGSGPIPEGVPVIVDIFPKHLESGCWGDLTRTLCVGEPPEELQRWHRDVREAQRRATEAVRPGVTGDELNRVAMDWFASQGHATRHDGEVEEGFKHPLGHGVGLEVHEAPWLDHGGEALVAGDVITIEPGLYRDGFGGCRLEDLVLVTADGYELLTRAPYELAP